MEEFEQLLKDHEGLLKQLTYKAKADLRLRNANIDDVYSLVQYAAWTAFLDYKKKDTPYQYTTFLTKHIQTAKNRVYKDLLSSKETTNIEFKNKVTKHKCFQRLETQDLLNKVFTHLDCKEKKFIKNRFYNHKTLEECGKELQCSLSSVKDLELKTLDKIRAYGNKYA